MTRKFSPAPWKQYETDDGDVMVRMDDAHEVYITNLEGSCGVCHANADLIAAAPELLESLESVMWIIESFNFIDTGGIKAKARIIISKAKGES